MMKKLLSLLLATMMLLSAIPAVADDIGALARQTFFEDLLAAAKAGDADAQVEVALAYYEGGDAVEKDYQTAYNWFVKAAETGNAVGQYNAGFMLLSGVLGEPDYDAALHWLEKAAAQNHEYALINLGAMYASGLGVDKDAAKAEAYYQQAADLCSATGWLQLGQLRYSSGAEGSLAEAFQCFEEAANLGNAQAAYNLGVMTANGESVEADHAAALEWYIIAADLGMARAQITVGAYYLGTNGIEADYDKAFQYFSMATQQGDADALYFLGLCYEQGFGTEVNTESAMNCYEVAAMMGNESAKERISVLKQMQTYMDLAEENGEAGSEQP